MSDWFTQGERVASLAVDDRGLQYGDGLFETVAIRNGEPRLWTSHMERLARGCNLWRIKLPDPDELLAGVMNAVSASNVPSAYAVVKIIVTAGRGLRGYGRGEATTPSVLYGAFIAAPASPRSYGEGVETLLCDTRLASHSAFAGIKTLNRLEQVLARSEVVATDAFEGLTMDADDNIICGTMSNVFFVHKNRLTTAAVEHSGVAGVMRRHIIEVMSEQGLETEFRYTSSADLNEVDEVFLSNSQFGVLPVNRCGSSRWAVGDVTQRVMAVLADSGISECRR
jgi:4-amino-4-deoxychorismate lyase